MSVWKRLRGLLGGPADEDGEADAGSTATPAPEPDAEEPPDTPEGRLLRLGELEGPVDDDEVLRLVDQLVGAGRGARALDLARRILDRQTASAGLSLRVAELLSSRGDDAAAFDQLREVLAVSAPPISALMLAGELSERGGDDSEALAFYERVLARDVDYPRARERVQRLRERSDSRASLAGATLMADGALARGRYRVEAELGRGGAGTVFAAQDVSLGRRVALKVYHRRGRYERERLVVEARTPARLEHPGIVRIFDLDPELGAIAMEWVTGGSVRQQMSRGPVPLSRALTWLDTALDALSFVHGSGFVHRDVKPSNFLLRAGDRVVLTDFGLAAADGEVPPSRGQGGEGTLAYMAPEQRAGVAAAPAADVHAFGASMREILGVLDAEAPEPLLEVALSCMRRDPAQRPDVPWLRSRLAGAAAAVG